MKQLPAISMPVESPVYPAGNCQSPADASKTATVTKIRTRQSGNLHVRFGGYMAFGAAVFFSMVAAATVASQDVPLMLGGF